MMKTNVECWFNAWPSFFMLAQHLADEALTHICLMLGRSRRRQPNIKATLGQRLVFAGVEPCNLMEGD